jgi:hypothetical protein
VFERYFDEKWLGLDDYFKIHRARFIQTWAFVQRLGLPKKGRVLDVGGVGPLAGYMAEALDWSVDQTNSDLRYELKSTSSDSFDLVLCTETIEHIKDRESSAITDLEAFNFSGVLSMLRELGRATKQHGYIVVTTPNANSYISLHKWAMGEAVMMDPKHVREFSVSELKSAMRTAGLQVVATEVVSSWEDSFGEVVIELKRRLDGMKELQGFQRGDNIMMAATK